MDINTLVQLISIAGFLWRLERRFNRIEYMIRDCPHIDEKKGPLVPTKTTF